MDTTKLLDNLLGMEDGESPMRHRAAVVQTVNTDGTLTVLMGTSSVIVHALAGSVAEVGDTVHLAVWAGDLLSLGAVGISTPSHIRLTAAAGENLSANSWAILTKLTTTAESSGPQLWTTAAGVVTLTADGLYSITFVASTNVATFAIGIYSVGDTTMLAQTALGTSVSLSNSVSVTGIRLAAGAQIAGRIYPSTGMTASAHTNGTPCYLAITRIGD